MSSIGPSGVIFSSSYLASSGVSIIENSDFSEHENSVLLSRSG